MSCHRSKDGTVIICTGNDYRYKGFYFEWHSYLGPHPLKRNGDPRITIPKGFWGAIAEFSKLTDKQKEAFRA